VSIQRSGPNRIIWSRRGDNDVVRIFATQRGERVAVRGLWEERDRGDRSFAFSRHGLQTTV
jgi:hypothetical protein